jgi:signal transduction histidine kinase/uncharacterized protein YneF (UPF0154 family)
MKLLARYSRINVVATIAIFLVAASAFFFSLRYLLMNQIDDDLRIEEREIQLFVQKHGQLPESMSVDDQLIEFAKVGCPLKRQFKTLMLAENEQGEMEKYRQLEFGLQDTKGWHRVSVSKSLEQTDDLVTTIFSITVITIIFILLVSLLLNRWAVKRIWRPFYKSLDAVGNYKISDGLPLRLPPSQVDEFEAMNKSLVEFAGQARSDYLSLKTFSENATHELQTPIAIIRSKLDMLQQEPNLSGPGVQALQGAYDSLQRLNRINQSLLLLARIENNQFAEKEKLDMSVLIQQKLDEFRELLQEKKISVSTNLQPASVFMNAALCQLLLNNLFSNALRYTDEGGNLDVILDPAFFELANTSAGDALAEDGLYQRFQRPDQKSNTAGLGLALAKQVCDASGFIISYRHHKGQHLFRVSW